MEYKYVLYEKRGQVVIITMNRPERRNSLSWEMLRDLRMALQEFQDDSGALVSVLTGAGAAFCAGRDLKQATEMTKLSDSERANAEQEMERWNILRDRLIVSGLTKPFVTAINGPAIGGGFILATSGILRVAAQSAMFQLVEISIGGMAGWDFTQTQIVPFCVATEIALGRRISAQRAYEVGLVNKVTPDAELMSAAIEMAEYIAGLPPLSVKYTIDGLRKSRVINATLAELQAMRLAQIRVSEDVKEAAQAFAEKRKPVFKGR